MQHLTTGLRAVSLAAMLLTTAWSNAQAQSLVDLYESARGYDASYLSARLQFEAAQSQYEQRRALKRPTVSAQTSVTLSDVDSSSRSETASVTESTPQIATQLRSSASKASSSISTSQGETRLGVTAQHPLFNRTNDITVEQAQRALSQAEISVKAAEQDLIVRVSQAYFDLLATQDNLKLLQAQKAAVQEQLASAKRRFEVGTATIIDTREAQASYDLILAQEIAFNGELAVRKSALEQLVGKTGLIPFSVRAGLSFPEIEQTEQRWITRGDANPQLQSRKLDLEIARLETQKAQAGHLPTVALTAGLTRNFLSGSSNTASYSTTTGSSFGGNTVASQSTSNQNTWPGNNTNASVGVQLNVPLFSGYAVQNRIKETLSLAQKAEKDLEGTQRTVAQSIRSVFFKLMADQGQVKALEAAELSRQSALQSNQLGYQVGVGTNIDVLNSQSLLFQTRRDLARARYEVLVGGLRLKQAAGVLAAEDLQPINSQLTAP